jgi:hypothetical protein
MALEAWVLDGITLTSGSFVMMSLTADPPKAKPEWVSNVDSEWATLLDEPRHENREFAMKLRVPAAANMDAALDLIASIRDKLRKASRQQDGVALVWTPHGSARSRTFDVLYGEVTEIPIGIDGEPAQWFKANPIFTITLTAKPYWYDTSETLTGTTTASTPIVSMDVTGVGGDISALGRLIVTDAATQPRGDFEWGLENRTYVGGTSLTIDSDSMTVNSGTQTTRSGAYDPNATGNNVIRASTVWQPPIAICGAYSQTHIGSFRVWVRVYVARPSQRIRLAWRLGDNKWTTNDWVTPPIAAAGWCEMDLGTITIPTVVLGTQSWDGRIDAYEADVTLAPGAVDVDYMRLMPAGEGYGRARATFAYSPGVTVAYDQFATASGVLGGDVAPLGGTWAATLTGVGTTDLTAAGTTVATSQGGSDNRRLDRLGSTNYTNIEVSVDVTSSRPVTISDGAGGNAWITQGVLARYVDSSNYLSAVVFRSSGYATTPPSVSLLVQTATVMIASVSLPASLPLTTRVRLLVFASGVAVAQVLETSGAVIATCMGSSSLLATGGALATGTPGIIDTNYQFTTPPTRTYDNFVAATPDTFNPVINSGRTLQVRHDGALSANSAGTLFGEPSYRGARFLVPPGTSRVAVASRRYDLAANGADNVTDSTSIQVGYKLRGLVVPRV